jgi:hypothetical protein
MSTTQADALGAVIPTSVLIYGQFDRGSLDASLAARGIGTDPKVRVRRSWDPFDPDNTIGLAKTKKLLGEFAYRVTDSGAVLVDDGWRAAYVPNREPYPTGIFAACNNAIKADLTAAGKPSSTPAGGSDRCRQRQHLRWLPGRGSRESSETARPYAPATWAQALTPTPSPTARAARRRWTAAVRIFSGLQLCLKRQFINPDGCTERVGEPRNTFLYPSRYCPNVPGGGLQSLGLDPPRTTRDSRGSMFADDGWALAGD